jgi:hypothetical protein
VEAIVRKFEVRDGKVVLEFDGTDLQILDAMSHRYCKDPAKYFEPSDVEQVKGTICDALDFFYMNEEWED